MKQLNQLTRSCIACGEEKPLSAFLQIMSDTQGTRYGSVCANCRGQSAVSILPSTDSDEDGSGTTGHRIGIKEKIQIELDAKRAQQHSKELNHKEQKKRQRLIIEKFDRTDLTEKAEKNHRNTFLDEKKKRSFLDYQSQKTPLSRQNILSQNPAEKAGLDEQENIRNDVLVNSINLIAPFLDQDLSKQKYNNPAFLQFLAWLGLGAPATQFLKQRIFSETKLKAPSEPLVEYAEKNWGPSSRKR